MMEYWNHLEDHEDDLRRRQREHLARVRRLGGGDPRRPCAHDSCPQCLGTGVKLDGSPCIHAISCHCPKCSPQYLALQPSTTGTDLTYSLTAVN